MLMKQSQPEHVELAPIHRDQASVGMRLKGYQMCAPRWLYPDSQDNHSTL